MIIDRLKLLLLIVFIQSALSNEETANIIKDNVERIKSAVKETNAALEKYLKANGLCADSLGIIFGPKPIKVRDGHTDKTIEDYLRKMNSNKAFAKIDKAMSGL